MIDDLAHKNARARSKTFHWFAIGNEDGERKFFFKPSNPTNSSFYEVPGPELQPRIVPVRRLDTLFKEGLIPKADFPQGGRRRPREGRFRGGQATCSPRAYWELNPRPARRVDDAAWRRQILAITPSRMPML